MHAGAYVNENEEIQLLVVRDTKFLEDEQTYDSVQTSKYLGSWVISDELKNLVMAFRIMRKKLTERIFRPSSILHSIRILL